MKKLILPLVLLLIGIGGGVSAGLYLFPAPVPETPATADIAEMGPCGEPPTDGHAAADEHAAPDDHAATDDHAAEDGHAGGVEYVELNDQFIVPIVEDSEVTALMILSISIEVPAGQKDIVTGSEPRIRDAFLQVLFNHANSGGFEGMFTTTEAMVTLRNALRNTGQDALGPVIKDVLIVDIVRQDV